MRAASPGMMPPPDAGSDPECPKPFSTRDMSIGRIRPKQTFSENVCLFSCFQFSEFLFDFSCRASRSAKSIAHPPGPEPDGGFYVA